MFGKKLKVVGNIIRCITVNQLRYDSFSQKYHGASGQVFIVFDGIFIPHCKALVCLLLAEYHLKLMFKEPSVMNLYQFSNILSNEWQSWKADDGSSILSELVVKLYNRKWLKHCVMNPLVARRWVIMMIATEVDSDKRLT